MSTLALQRSLSAVFATSLLYTPFDSGILGDRKCGKEKKNDPVPRIIRPQAMYLKNVTIV